jgi:hypothetical protein
VQRFVFGPDNLEPAFFAPLRELHITACNRGKSPLWDITLLIILLRDAPQLERLSLHVLDQDPLHPAKDGIPYFLLDDLLQLTQLHTLEIGISPRAPWWLGCIFASAQLEVCRRLPALTHLSINGRLSGTVAFAPDELEGIHMAKLLARDPPPPKLRYINMRHQELTQEHTEALPNIPTLTVVEFNGVRNEHVDFSFLARMHHMTTLHMRGNVFRQHSSRPPHAPLDVPSIIERLCATLQLCPQLTTLTFEQQYLEPRDMQRILAVLPSLTRVHAPGQAVPEDQLFSEVDFDLAEFVLTRDGASISVTRR